MSNSIMSRRCLLTLGQTWVGSRSIWLPEATTWQRMKVWLKAMEACCNIYEGNYIAFLQTLVLPFRDGGEPTSDPGVSLCKPCADEQVATALPLQKRSAI